MTRPAEKKLTQQDFNYAVSARSDFLNGLKTDSIYMSKVKEILDGTDEVNKRFLSERPRIVAGDLIKIIAMRDATEECASGSWFIRVFSKAIKKNDAEITSRLLEVARDIPFLKDSPKRDKLFMFDDYGDWSRALKVFLERNLEENKGDKNLRNYLFESRNCFLSDGEVVGKEVLAVLCKEVLEMTAVSPEVKAFVEEARKQVSGKSGEKDRAKSELLEATHNAISSDEAIRKESKAKALAICGPTGVAREATAAGGVGRDGGCAIQ